MNSICSARLPYLASWWLMLSAACPSIALYETCSPSAATSSYGVLLHSPTGTVDLCWRRRLLVGVPTLRGPGPKAPDISSVLLNKDRISHKLQKVRAEAKSTKGGDSLNLDEFAAFNADNPGLVVNSIVGKITVISIQQPLMLAELVKEMVVTSEPVNGVVSDTAHCTWLLETVELLVGFLSYTNGATAKHYQHHFFALFKSIAQERARQGWDASGDEHFGTVVDFSEAEHLGFIAAFVQFQQSQGSTRTTDDLKAAAEGLLKGCKQHFRTGIARLTRMGGVILQGEDKQFRRLTKALLNTKDLDVFYTTGKKIIKDFPKVAPWFEWWMRPEHASMLFESQ
ncbi:hypothetical protein OH76DRAFT_1424204 [Lentinus brumalis]|uniref:Uncharacterized protein n=1 Tax=Lentinus brumalis TaxID=2498619 RepID=A0A371CH75_9APHY|nr:hypothetical protein OH76DRAFT_1424204 [Polyporus brumalis]